ncbi:MAG: hypothetical protein GY814_07475, partial [Gammaproteobacteria bacterium]|nr:hypothetical protein [Gammaproteobacteria bacterium]
GGTNNDTFDIAEGGSVTGAIDGGGGTSNTLHRSNTTGSNSWLITGNDAGSVTYGDTATTFRGINTLVGSSASAAAVTDTLTGRNDYTTTWSINGTADTVTTNGNEISFSEMENLTGGDDNDIFNITDYDSVTGTIDGGLHGANVDDGDNVNVNITSDADLTITLGAGADFDNIETLSVTGTASSNSVTLQRNNTTGDNDWLITGNDAGSVTYGDTATTFSGINTLVGSSTQWVTDTLTGRSDDTTIWSIDGADTVTTNGNTINFSAMENLTGGTNNDTFDIAEGGSVTGTIDGGGGTSNTLQRSNITGDNDWLITGDDA